LGGDPLGQARERAGRLLASSDMSPSESCYVTQGLPAPRRGCRRIPAFAEVSSYRITPRTTNRTQIESYYKTQLQKKIHWQTASSTAGLTARHAHWQGRASPDPSARAQRMSLPRGHEGQAEGSRQRHR
jgi:hypothetical protein